MVKMKTNWDKNTVEDIVIDGDKYLSDFEKTVDALFGRGYTIEKIKIPRYDGGFYLVVAVKYKETGTEK